MVVDRAVDADAKPMGPFASGGFAGDRQRHPVPGFVGWGMATACVIDIQDRDGAPLALASIVQRWPTLHHIFADGAYAGPKLKAAPEKIGRFVIQIVERSDHAKGFQVLPRRWVVERTFAWLGRCRRLA